ncbi:hypothetical protein J437_LFUL002184, partial [Ladona fulva]
MVHTRDRPQLPDQPARRGGGTTVLVADRHITHPILPELKPCDELESAAIDVKTSFGTVRLVSCNLPPQRRLNPAALDNVLAQNLPSILAGKRLLQWATNHSIGIIAPRDTTHYTAKGSGDILDIIILSRLPPPTAVYTIPALSSDHLP